MFVELHLLQNFAPSNLNRDDTGAPKDCEFGGYRRARISSQCLKRAVRSHFRKGSLLGSEYLAVRTKRLADDLARRLQEHGKEAAQARAVAQVALRGVGLGIKDDGKSEYLLFVGDEEVANIAEQCLKYWDTLVQAVGNQGQGGTAGSAGGKTGSGGKGAKKSGKDAVIGPIADALHKAFDRGKAADLALFGRMLADLPQKNVDAASQVAHAISTNKVSIEFDFYTAVDDLKPDETAGADMLGTVEFNSACFYRYANVDLEQLRQNLDDDELARQTLEAFVRASIEAVPTGKQNSMAAQNPPSLVFAVVRHHGLWSLANAFTEPVRPDQHGDLVQNSIQALDAYWGRLAGMYGQQSVLGKWVALLDGDGLQHLAGSRVETVDRLVEEVLAATAFSAAPQSSAA